MVRVIALILMLLTTAVEAQDRHVWKDIGGTTSIIVLQPTDAPDAVAEVFFDNKAVHNDEDLTFDLTDNGLTVSVYARVGRGATPDRVEVYPPAGYYALPASIDVQEYETGRILIYIGTGIGM